MATGSTVKPVLWATSRGQANGQAGRLRVGQDELLTLDMLAVLSGKAQPSLGAASDPSMYPRKASAAAATPSGQGGAAGTAAVQGSGRPTSARTAGGLPGGNKSQVVSKSGRPISASLLVQSSKTSPALHMRPGSAPVTPTKAGAAGAGAGAGAGATDAVAASAKKAAGAGGTVLLPRTGGTAPAGSLASRTAPSPTSTSGRGFSPAPGSGTAAAAFKVGSGASTGPATTKGQGGGGLRRPLSAGTVGTSSGVGAAAAAGYSLYSTTPVPGSRGGAGAGPGMRRTLSAGHVQPGSRPLSARTRIQGPGVVAGSKPGSDSKPEPPLLGRLFEHVNASRPRPATPSLTADPPHLSELRRSHSLTSSSLAPAPAQGPSAPQAQGADGTASSPAATAHVETPSTSSAARGGEPTGAGLSPAAASVMHAFHTRGAAAGSGMNAIKMAVANAQQHLASSLLATPSGVASMSGGQVGSGTGAGGAGGAGAAGQDLRGAGAAGTAGDKKSDDQARGVGATDQGPGLKVTAHKQIGSGDGRGRDSTGPAAAATMLAASPAPLEAAAAAAAATPTEAALLQPAVTRGVGAAPSTDAASSAMPSPGVTVTGPLEGSAEAASAANVGATQTAPAAKAGMASATAAETTEKTTKLEASEAEVAAATAAEVPVVAPAPATSGSKDAHETLQAANRRPDGMTLGVTVPTPSCSSSAAPSPKAEKSGESVGTPTGQRHSPDSYRLLTVNIPDAGEAGVISHAATKQRPVHTGSSYAQRHQQQQQQQWRSQHDVHGPQAQAMVMGMAAQLPGSSLSPAPPLPEGLPDPSTQTLHDLLVESAELSEVWGVDAGWLARVLGQGGVGPRA